MRAVTTVQQAASALGAVVDTGNRLCVVDIVVGVATIVEEKTVSSVDILAPLLTIVELQY